MIYRWIHIGGRNIIWGNGFIASSGCNHHCEWQYGSILDDHTFTHIHANCFPGHGIF